MSITRFTKAYDQARATVANYKWPLNWETLLRKTWLIPALMTKDGLDYRHAGGLNRLKATISGQATRTSAEVIATAINAKRKGFAGLLGFGNPIHCAATLKMLKHLNFEHKRGGQDVWVYSPPKAYTKWIFDEIKGTPAQIKAKLALEIEVYTAAQKQLMCTALQLALRSSKFAMFFLSFPVTDVRCPKDQIRRWFAYASSSDKDIEKIRIKLLDGFKKIAAICNSNRLIFSDEPLDRSGTGWKDWAFVYSSERVDVVYLQNAFLKASEGGKLWECGLTIIHEISHRELKTKDHAYADQANVKPHPTSFSTKKALENADTWAFFATDLGGQLPTAAKNTALMGAYA
jgi:Lysine-specific metallo-endopeptidase